MNFTVYSDNRVVVDAFGAPHNLTLVFSCRGQTLWAQRHPALTKSHFKWVLLSFLLSIILQHCWSPLRMFPYSMSKCKLGVQVLNNSQLIGGCSWYIKCPSLLSFRCSIPEALYASLAHSSKLNSAPLY